MGRAGPLSIAILRSATKERLDGLERLSLFGAIADEGTPPILRAAWLRIMAVVVGTLERRLDWPDGGPGVLPRLRAELVELDEVPPWSTSAIEPMLALVDELRRWPQEPPVRLFGALYAVMATLGAAGSMPGHRGAPEPSWRAFDRRLSALELSRAAAEPMIEAALHVLDRLIELARALAVRDGEEHAVVQTLNAEAGSQDVTHDPREVMAAIDAGMRTWTEHPYYEARYGARGRRFTRSDSAWLVVLTELGPRARLEQLQWLGRLLAARGMPTLLLEIHLRHLHEALVAAVPERAERYATLEAASRHLGEQRLAALPRFDELAASVPPHEVLGELGAVLISAVADERQGIPNAVSSVESWVTDPERSTAAWSDAVRRVMERARGRGGPEPV